MTKTATVWEDCEIFRSSKFGCVMCTIAISWTKSTQEKMCISITQITG